MEFDVTSIDADWVRDSVDVSHMLSAATAGDGWREFIPGLKSGTISLEILHEPSTWDNASLTNVPVDEVAEVITITWPKGTATTAATWACSGFVTGYSASAPNEDRMTATVEIQLSGKPTFTDAA